MLVGKTAGRTQPCRTVGPAAAGLIYTRAGVLDNVGSAGGFPREPGRGATAGIAASTSNCCAARAGAAAGDGTATARTVPGAFPGASDDALRLSTVYSAANSPSSISPD